MTRAFGRFGLALDVAFITNRHWVVGILVAPLHTMVTLARLLRFAGLLSASLLCPGITGLSAFELSQALAANSPLPQQLASGVDRPPLMLLAVGRLGLDLFDAARRSSWRDADLLLEEMKASAATVPSYFSDPDVASQFRSRVEDVGNAVSGRQRWQTMDFANGITRLVADLSDEHTSDGPYALVLLGFYGRELELGIESGDQVRLKRAIADLRQTWNHVERVVLQRGAIDDARRFTDVVVELEGATTPAEFAESTRAELNAVNSLERVFGK